MRPQKHHWKSPIARALVEKSGERDPVHLVERVCTRLRNRLGKRTPPFQTDRYEYAHLFGVKVIENDALFPSGMLSWFRGKFVIELRADESPFRKSYTVCHELGHLELRRIAEFSCPNKDTPIIAPQPSSKEEERLVEMFAANLLMPKRIFKPRAQQLPPCFKSLKKLAALFYTSLGATIIRIVELDAWKCFVMLCRPETLVGGEVATRILSRWRLGGINDPSCGQDYVRWGSHLISQVYLTRSAQSEVLNSENGRRWELCAVHHIRNNERTVTALLVPVE